LTDGLPIVTNSIPLGNNFSLYQFVVDDNGAGDKKISIALLKIETFSNVIRKTTSVAVKRSPDLSNTRLTL
jgi:hypothetical protein